MKEVRIEVLTEILEEIGLNATDQQIEKIAEDYAIHLEMESEMSSYQFTGNANECGGCDKLKIEIKQKNSEITRYQNSVKKRRNAEHVWLDGDSVMYEG